jgi:hypothetical protein
MAGGGSSKDKKTMVENGTGKLRSLKERLSFSREKTPAENLDASLSELLPENTVKSSINGSDKYRLLLENIVINGLLNIAEDKLMMMLLLKLFSAKHMSFACPSQDCTEAGMVFELPAVTKSSNSEEITTLPCR